MIVGNDVQGAVDGVGVVDIHADQARRQMADGEELHELHLVEHALETLPWNWVPLGASLLVALGGLFVGWWIYGRKPLVKDQQDPLVAPLGPLHVFLNHKWYWDELYQIIFIRPINYFSEVIVYEVMDKGIIDGI